MSRPIVCEWVSDEMGNTYLLMEISDPVQLGKVKFKRVVKPTLRVCPRCHVHSLEKYHKVCHSCLRPVYVRAKRQCRLCDTTVYGNNLYCAKHKLSPLARYYKLKQDPSRYQKLLAKKNEWKRKCRASRRIEGSDVSQEEALTKG